MTNLVACQMVSGPDVDANLASVRELLQHQNKGDVVVLPECFACFGTSDKALLTVSERKGEGPIQQQLSAMAKEFGVWLIAGTMPLKTDDPHKYSASCLVFDAQGRNVCEYQKIHLFDVDVADNTRSYRESKYTQAGHQLMTVDTPVGRLGLAVCYDVRFPGMFQAMADVDIISLPSAFTRTTGAAHWHALIKARAIENQCYLIAANQGGVHDNGRETYGHSFICSPWGENLSEIEHGQGFASAEFDANQIARIRTNMPVKQHNQFRSYLV